MPSAYSLKDNRSKHPLYETHRSLFRYHKDITCEKWLKDFWSFVDDVGVRPSKNHRLKRMNGKGIFEPGNTRWRETVPLEDRSEKIKQNLCARLRKKYGISMEEFEKISERQNHVCAICNRSEDEVCGTKGKRLSVDHCHQTGKIRGLLCSNCNRALGSLGDNLSGIMAATRYLAQGGL